LLIEILRRLPHVECAASNDMFGPPMNNAQTKSQQANWVERSLLGIILLSVLFCAALLALPIWSAITQTALQQAEPRQCIAINDDAARLECYDKQVSRRPASPAKGPRPPGWLFGQ
jgi:hypothetical protein